MKEPAAGRSDGAEGVPEAPDRNRYPGRRERGREERRVPETTGMPEQVRQSGSSHRESTSKVCASVGSRRRRCEAAMRERGMGLPPVEKERTRWGGTASNPAAVPQKRQSPQRGGGAEQPDRPAGGRCRQYAATVPQQPEEQTPAAWERGAPKGEMRARRSQAGGPEGHEARRRGGRGAGSV